ncbi:hypothetical protein [uncultured Shewanella sp.]|uniref:hypothetical protein n=1 Tax=uncultured Shewanella sp. TaxID=173975 RepID=UPI0026070164|nr:hypothetical protein [uncultured Shewanella sp.]
MNTLLKIIQLNAIIALVSFSAAAFSSDNYQKSVHKVDNHSDNQEKCEYPIISRIPIVIF